jgi:hypothetical protein
VVLLELLDREMPVVTVQGLQLLLIPEVVAAVEPGQQDLMQ